MGSPDFEILDESGANASAEFLERELLHALQSENEQSVNDRIVLTVRNQAEDIIAGLVGSTSYGWLLIKVLWVDRDYRGRSLGRNLVEAAENIHELFLYFHIGVLLGDEVTEAGLNRKVPQAEDKTEGKCNRK